MQFKLRSFGHFLLCLTALTLLSEQSLSFADQKTEAAKKDMSGIRKKIDTIEKALNQTIARQDDVADALKASETAISVANKKLYETKQAQQQNELQLTTLQQESQAINERLQAQQKQLGALLYQQYVQGYQSYTKLILESKSPSEIARNLRYQSYIAKAHTKLIDSMQSNLDEIKALDAKITSAQEKVVALKEKQEKERNLLEKEKAKKQSVLKKLSKAITAQKGQIEKLKRDEKHLSNLVKELTRAAKRKQQQAQQAKLKRQKERQVDKKDTTDVIANNQQTPDDSYAGKRFTSLKGKLKLPVVGEVMNRFGHKRKNGGLTWKGLFIRAKEGAPVKSVASGRVVFAEWMRGFGNLIIIDHGNGYMSLYGNNQAILKNVGDPVTAGDTIAQVGNTGGNQSDGLYYELRHQSVPFDPLAWSAVR